jgi:hypothetical protein
MKGAKTNSTAGKLISIRIRESVYKDIVRFAKQNRVNACDVLTEAARNYIDTGMANAMFPKNNA